MKKHFYSNLISVEEISVELEGMSLSKKEKEHLLELLDLNIHHSILDFALSELSEEDKKIFLKHVSDGQHDKIWSFLNSKIKDAEYKVNRIWEELKDKFHKDINEAKNK